MKAIFLAVSILFIFSLSFSQETKTKVKIPELKKNLNESGSQFIKASFVAQFWGRYNENNPGTLVDGYPQSTTSDIGLRRLRFNVFGQVTDRVAFHVQFGQNNFSYLSKQQTGSFFHDALAEYKVFHKGYLTFGAGLTGYSGLLRYAAPSVGSILGVDAPLYQQVTNGINDQFLRKFSFYGKGQIAGFDYRIALVKPMSAINSLVAFPSLNANQAVFSFKPPHWQQQAYVQYQLFDKESNALGYTTGTYLGTKKIVNIGLGIIHQKNAMWLLNNAGDTTYANMTLLGADVYGELPLSERKNAITFYLAFSDFQMGQNFIRNLGVMNPANGVLAGQSLAGGGNALPLIGTGQTVFGQLGYKFKDNLLRDNGSLQLYSSAQYSSYEYLDDPMLLIEGGVNWLIHGTHGAKLTLGLQSRPVYQNLSGNNQQTDRRNMYVLQYQIFI
jgi:Phosphate-selective porin O and P